MDQPGRAIRDTFNPTPSTPRRKVRLGHENEAGRGVGENRDPQLSTLGRNRNPQSSTLGRNRNPQPLTLGGRVYLSHRMDQAVRSVGEKRRPSQDVVCPVQKDVIPKSPVSFGVGLRRN
jgi:hypothetical protein